MLDPRPYLTERLKALGVFSGIAIAAVSGFELVITGGLDPITPRVVADAPSEYDEETVMQSWHYRPYVPTVYVTETSQHLGYPIDEAVLDELAGGPRDPTAPQEPAYASAEEEEDLAREIERLYEETARMATELEASLADDASPIDAAAPADDASEELPPETAEKPEAAPEIVGEREQAGPVEIRPLPDWLTAYETASPS